MSLFQVIQRTLAQKQSSATKTFDKINGKEQTDRQLSPTTRFQTSLQEPKSPILEDYAEAALQYGDDDEVSRSLPDESRMSNTPANKKKIRKSLTLNQFGEYSPQTSPTSSSPQIPSFSPKSQNSKNDNPKAPISGDFDEEGFLHEEKSDGNDKIHPAVDLEMEQKVSNFFQKKLQQRSVSEQNLLKSIPLDIAAAKSLKKGSSTVEQANVPPQNVLRGISAGFWVDSTSDSGWSNNEEEVVQDTERLKKERKESKKLIKKFLKRFMKFKRKRRVAETINFIKAAGKDKDLILKV